MGKEFILPVSCLYLHSKWVLHTSDALAKDKAKVWDLIGITGCHGRGDRKTYFE